MKTIFHSAQSRGSADLGWLKTKYSFSFANYYNPAKMNFGTLRVFNDDTIGPNTGFGTHAHDNMEIVTIVFEGEISHKDSMGNNIKITKDEVQIMSAGYGITHSEYNLHPTQNLSLFQLWIMPKLRNITPRYGQTKLLVENRHNKWDTFITPNPNTEMQINQDAYFSMAFITKNTTLKYELKNHKNGVYLFIMNGNVQMQDFNLISKDALGVWQTQDLQILANEDSQILAIEVPM